MIVSRLALVYRVHCDYCPNAAHEELTEWEAKNIAYQTGYGDLTTDGDGTWMCRECANRAGVPHLKPGEQRKAEEENKQDGKQ